MNKNDQENIMNLDLLVHLHLLNNHEFMMRIKEKYPDFLVNEKFKNKLSIILSALMSYMLHKTFINESKEVKLKKLEEIFKMAEENLIFLSNNETIFENID